MIHRPLVVFALLCLLPLTAPAQNTPVGRWRSIDDATGKPKEYSVKFTPIAGGKRLEVRGFLGVALLGRTQTWLRESP